MSSPQSRRKPTNRGSRHSGSFLEKLDCGPGDIVHVSSSCQYDLRPATDLGVRRLVLVNRRDEAVYPWLRFQRVDGIEGLPDAITAS